MKRKPELIIEDIGVEDQKRRVRLRDGRVAYLQRKSVSQRIDGTIVSLGLIEHVNKSHIPDSIWEATGHDGHRGMHTVEVQAIRALMWDGKGYPFPMSEAAL